MGAMDLRTMNPKYQALIVRVKFSCSYTDVLSSLSGQLELFYTTIHAHLQTLRFYAYYTFSPRLRHSLLVTIDKAYENLVVRIEKCCQIAHCLKVAHVAHPQVFLVRQLPRPPVLFLFPDDQDNNDEQSDESPMHSPPTFKQENSKLCAETDAAPGKRQRDEQVS
ncbi:uncharacterized protein LOC121858177 [Homarus americanus]|uniref:uncharacterized protein LOC121858177 n=1 Tax=Homarus americanus TaxID=6706 RepID=UPI001C4456F7|nr:uncharacterized protein LOC121858177 [Homarus americanus]